MPALHNLKHENFCQLTVRGVAQGLSQAQIYQMDGYKAEGHAAAMAASRLMKKDEIRVRLAELTAPAERKTRTTVDSLAAQFDAVFDGAMGSAQFGAAGSAAAAKSKLLGFMRERLEIGGVGEFDQCQTTDQVIEALLSRHESPQAALEELDQLREMVATYASNHAVTIVPAAPARARPNETALSLAHSLPKRRRR
jgi:hypothetical protein